MNVWIFGATAVAFIAACIFRARVAQVRRWFEFRRMIKLFRAELSRLKNVDQIRRKERP